MSLTSVTRGDDEEIDTDSQQQTSVQKRNERNVKLTAVSSDGQKPIARTSSLTSLGDLSAILKEQLDKDDTRRAVSIKTNILINSSGNLTDTFDLKTNARSKSLNELSERLKKLKNNENSSTGTKIRASVSMAVVSGPTRSASNSISSLENLFLKERERIKEDESFVTVEPCQQEKTTGTEALTVFSMENRTQHIIVARSDNANRPPPPYDYSQRNQYQGGAGQTPAYQMQSADYATEAPQDASSSPPYRSGDTDPENLFNTQEIRNNFVRKVYAILAVQLLFTFGSITVSIYVEDITEFLRDQKVLAIVSLVCMCVILIALTCSKNIRRIFPLNFILLSLLTVFMTIVMAFISCHMKTNIVMISMGASAGICILLTLLACTSWFDITQCGMMLCIASLIIIAYGIVALIVTLVTGSDIMYIIYAGLVTVLFCMYLMYDTQQILGGRRIELSPEEYIVGTLTLYIDIMAIFQNVMVLFSKAS